MEKCVRGVLKVSLLGAVVAAVVASANAQPQSQRAPVLNERLRKELADYLIAHFQSPEDYVASKFKNHDLVFLGEAAHGVRQNLLFLHKLIPRLYEAGILNVGYEMIFSDEQPEVDKLLNAETYDETKALTLLFHWDGRLGLPGKSTRTCSAWPGRSIMASPRELRAFASSEPTCGRTGVW